MEIEGGNPLMIRETISLWRERKREVGGGDNQILTEGDGDPGF